MPEIDNTTYGTNVSKTVVGTTLNMKVTGVNTLFGANSQLQATLTIIGKDSGARVQIPVTITKTSQVQAGGNLAI